MTTGNHNSRERPILFSAPMVRAILEGRKTQTRRIVRNEFGVCAACFADPLTAVPHNNGDGGMGVFGSDPYLRVAHCEHTGYGGGRIRCPQGAVGDRLWVRETWAHDGSANKSPSACWFRAEPCKRDYPGVPCEHGPERWRPSIFMPRWASRILLDVVDVRVEQLQDISEADARAEGVPLYDGFGPWEPRESFRYLWDSINGKRAAWARNPWVWVVEFKRSEAVARAD